MVLLVDGGAVKHLQQIVRCLRLDGGHRLGRQPPSKRSKPTEPVNSVQLEASDNLLEVLNGASIDEEHRTVMSAVIRKVQSAKSVLTEACNSLLTGFEVSFKICKNITA